jgi:hypothetical protein
MVGRMPASLGLYALTMRHVLVSVALLPLLLGCSPDNGFKTRDVERSDFGDQWPFAAASGVLACEPGDVPTITVDGNTTALSEPDLSTKVFAAGATEQDVAVLREAALDLCD